MPRIHGGGAAVTTSPYASTIAQLEGEIGVLDQRRGHLQAAIDTLRGLDGAAGSPASMKPSVSRARASKSGPKPRPTAAPMRTRRAAAKAETPSGSGRSKLTQEQLAELQRCFVRGDSVEELAESMGLTGAAIYYHAKKRGWARGEKSSPKAAPAPGAKKITPAETPLRTCDSCYQKTRQDPCEHCGKLWKRG